MISRYQDSFVVSSSKRYEDGHDRKGHNMSDTWPDKDKSAEEPSARRNVGEHAPDEQPTQTMWQGPPPPPSSTSSQPWYGQPAPASGQKKTKRFGWPVFITAVAVPAVLGGGVGGVAADCTSSSNLAASNEAQQSPQLNRTDNVTPTTEAAAVASPSV